MRGKPQLPHLRRTSYDRGWIPVERRPAREQPPWLMAYDPELVLILGDLNWCVTAVGVRFAVCSQDGVVDPGDR